MAFSGEVLKQLRIRKKQSLQQVADAVEASKAHIWELETGKKSQNPSSDLLKRLAKHFDVGVSYLLGEDPNADYEEQELVAMFRELKDLEPSQREHLKVLMRSFADGKDKKED